jgi:hypothetical protein
MGEKIAWGSDTALMDEAADRIASLEAALAPFEELADEGNEDQPDDTPVVVKAGRSTIYTLRLSDLRRARAALSSSKQKDGGE